MKTMAFAATDKKFERKLLKQQRRNGIEKAKNR